MRIRNVAQIISFLTVGMCAWATANAQSGSLAGTVDNQAPVPSLVVERVDDAKVIRLPGNIHPMARAEFDRGAVEATLPMEGMLLVLKRSPQQEAALNKFMEEQLDPKSPNFHHWLQPEEFGSLYGPSEYDVQEVTNWLLNHGFSVDKVTKGRMFVQFSGNAALVQQAFHTQIHHYMVNGEAHIANSTDPQIPAALSPVVMGVVSLHNFFAKPMHHYLGDFTRKNKTDKWTPENPELISKPLFTVPGSSPTFELITPFDFATIYNVKPLWTAGINGAGQTIAIAGRTDISKTDVHTFRADFGLPVNDPVFIVNGPDPGVSADDKVENTLDVEWSGAVAPMATVKFVTTKSTATSDGASASAIYIIDNNIAKVMSFSYGNCELAYGTAGNTFNNTLWQQGAAQGISEFVASGDQGSAACDGGGTPPYGADQGLAVSGSSSTPYDIAVGGTDFNWVNLSKSYWSSTNATNGSSALSYIPEIPWNGTCASLAVDLYLGATGAGLDAEQACQAMLNGGFDTQFLSVTGGTGGVSKCTTPSGTTPATCSGGYAKPSWQKGTGVPADGKRDVPDVSLFSASGSLNDAYAICDSQTNPCTYTSASTALTQAVGGTSVASPAMAGIMALINQKMGVAQGNANVGFYALAAKDTRASCNSVTVAAGNACNFYDITTDNNAVPCIPGSVNCVLHHTGDNVGILSGYTSTVGYDLTTGLGSINANNLINNWASVAGGGPAVTLSPTSLTFASTTVGVATAAQVVTVKNTGTAALTLTSETITGTNATSFLKSATTCTTSLAVGASCTVSVEFKPTVAGALTASLSVADNATGTPQLVALKGTAVAATTTTVTVSPTSLTFASTTVGAVTAPQVVTIKNTGTAAVALTSETLTGTNATSFVKSATTCTTSLAVGASCTVSVEFKPTVAGALTASLSVADNATGTPQLVALKGTAVAATKTVTVSPTSLTFASTTVGAVTAPQVVTIKNTGTAAVTLTSETFTGTNATSFVKSATTCTTSLAVGASCTVSVEFKPTVAGALTASLSVADNATGTPQLVALKGTAVAAATKLITVSPTALTFASTAVGATTAAQVVTVKNTGTAAVTLTSETFTGTNATSFLKSATTCTTSLAAGASCTVSVEFKPTVAGALTASLSVADNATGTPQLVALKGTATAAATPTITLTPTSIAFPASITGTTSDAQVVTVKNAGTVAVTLTSITVGGTNATSFLELNSCGTSLAAGATCSLYVAFKPAAAGALTGTISVADNATGSPQKVTLTGTGTAAPSVKLSVASIAFAAQKSGTTSAAKVVTLTNGGTATLNLTSITLTGTNPTAFEALDTCGATLAPAASCTVYVAFKPTTIGALSAKLTIADNGAASPQSVTLTGTGN